MKSLLGLALAATSAVYTVAPVQANAAQFSCSGGDVTCLIASINSANQRSGKHTITLGPGVYRLTVIDNMVNGNTTLPVIMGNIRIRAASDTEPTAIENDTGGGFADASRMFFVSNLGNLTLEGIILQNSVASIDLLHNTGTTSIVNSIIQGITLLITGGSSAVHNVGKLTIANTIMEFNQGHHEGGGAITNLAGGVASIENSTIAHNLSVVGAIFNRGSLSIKKSAIVHNRSDLVQDGGAITNLGGTVEIVSSTLSGNAAGSGGAVFNVGGTVSLLNSTVAENISRDDGALFNYSGLLILQNTILANNIITSSLSSPDCAGDLASLGNNIIGDVAGCNISLQPSDHVGDPGLRALVGDDDENALPGHIYYPLLPGSPAINAGNRRACPNRDQLKTRKVGHCDVGAIEFQDQALLN